MGKNLVKVDNMLSDTQ